MKQNQELRSEVEKVTTKARKLNGPLSGVDKNPTHTVTRGVIGLNAESVSEGCCNK
jgi:hypothetical protein